MNSAHIWYALITGTLFLFYALWSWMDRSYIKERLDTLEKNFIDHKWERTVQNGGRAHS